ncbi:hypothetical protein ACOW0H_27825, partial [Klebsiella pneumoniae]
SAQIREILISESAWEEMTCLFAPSLKDISLCSYEGLHVLKIEIKSVGEVCHFENRYYIRQGTATHLITDGEAISSLHRLYYS